MIYICCEFQNRTIYVELIKIEITSGVLAHLKSLNQVVSELRDYRI